MKRLKTLAVAALLVGLALLVPPLMGCGGGGNDNGGGNNNWDEMLWDAGVWQ